MESKDSLLYIRFFDVAWDKIIQKPIPVSSLRFKDRIPTVIKICPVVYIKNEVFQNISIDSIPKFASNVYGLIKEILIASKKQDSILQFDCDWTLSTRKAYFEFLTNIKKLTTSKLQATIRLHQVKYYDKTGIPPVDQGVIMYYNFNQLGKSSINSIYERSSALLYLPYLKKYPLKHVFALPIFSWVVVKYEDKVTALMNKTNKIDLLTDSFLVQREKNIFEVSKSHFRNGYYLKQGSVLKVEDISIEMITQMKKDIERNSDTPPNGYIYFDLDSVNLLAND
ncbi:MAG: hypothetical protein ACK452_03770 [Bacteroidota bacterium]